LKGKQVSIVIPNYNGREYIEGCLQSLIEMNFPCREVEIIVVDNGSSDGSVDLINRNWPDVKLIINKENLGFSRAANQGAAAASGDYIAFLNSDMQVDKNWLSKLLEVIRDGIAIAGSKVMNWDGTAIDFFGRPDDAFCLSRGSDLITYKKVKPSLFASGGAALICRDIFRKVGGFDSDFFLYQEDIDLGWRLWLQGYKCVICSESVVYHRGGTSSSKLAPELIQALAQKNMLCCTYKNLSDENLCELFPVLVYFLLKRAKSAVVIERGMEEGLREFLLSLESVVLKRKEVQRSRVKSDEEIFSQVGHPFGFLLREQRYKQVGREIIERAGVRFDSYDFRSVRVALDKWLDVARSICLHEFIEEIREKEKRINELEAKLSELEEQLAEKDEAFDDLSLVLEERRNELASIKSSLGWRLLSYYGWFKYRYLLPLYRLLRLVPSRSDAERKRVAERRLRLMARRVASGDRCWERFMLTRRPSFVDLEALAGKPIKLRCADVICFSIIDWDFRYQRPQQVMTQFARHGHRVFYISSTRFLQADAIPRVSATKVSENIYEVSLASHWSPQVYNEVIDGVNLELMLEALGELRRSLDISEAIAYVMIASWGKVALAARERWGWRVIYDCMDEWENFPGIKQPVLRMEGKLVEGSDLVLVTGQSLYEKWRGRGRSVVLVRNAVDYEFYARETAPNRLLAGVKHPVVGYYGAIADWFDIDLVAYAARKRPDYTFVLLGGVFGVDTTELRSLPNVKLLGQQPYKTMPQYLYHFDACIIPFKINSITKATDPVKVYEYLSAGKPVVATDLAELFQIRDYLYIAESRDDFVYKLDLAVGERDSELAERRRSFARRNTWEERYKEIRANFINSVPGASIIVVTHNNLEFTKLCIESVLRNTEYPNYELIIVDNASSDGSQAYLLDLSKHYSHIKFVFNTYNYGFARANNQGIGLASGEYLVLLNNDTVVPPGWLSRLLRHLKDPAIGMVGPVTNSVGNEAKVDVLYRSIGEMEAFARELAWRHEGEVADIRMLAMYCVAFRRETFNAVGPLDEQFGIGMFEDDDYSLRVRAKGLRVVCAADVFVHHFGQASFSKLIDSGEYDRLFEENRRRYEKKWGVVWEPHKHGQLKFGPH
jgi:GT2 family glycosyltransferase/glycosyltransferase involved in cell wall biosynthesis